MIRRWIAALVSTPQRRLLVLAAIVRLIPAVFIYGTEDVSAWHKCGQLMASGVNPYDTPDLISWPPLWPVLAWFSYVTSEATGLPFSFVVKLFPIGADLILIWLLFSAAAELSLPVYLTAAAYAFNPIAIYTSAIHGNFDAIPALFVTLAIIAAIRESADPNGVRAGAWLGIGAAFKTWPLLILPAFLSGTRVLRRQVTIAAVAIGVFLAAALLPWPLIGDAAIVSVARYRGFHGWWGIPAIEFLSGHDLPPRAESLIFYAAMAAVALLVLAKKTSVPRAALLLLLTFYVATPGFGLQYLLWIVPVALIADQRRCLAYSTIAGTLILFELAVRPYTGHWFDAIRLLPHSDFARSYGGPADHRPTAAGRLLLWFFFAYWWLVTLVAVLRNRATSVSAP